MTADDALKELLKAHTQVVVITFDASETSRYFRVIWGEGGHNSWDMLNWAKQKREDTLHNLWTCEINEEQVEANPGKEGHAKADTNGN